MKKSISTPKDRKKMNSEDSARMDNGEAMKSPKANQSLDVSGSSSSSPPADTRSSSGASCIFPMSRVWRLVRGEHGGGGAAEIRTTSEAVFVINKASEMFLELLTEDAYAIAKRDLKKYISYDHLSSTINREKRYEFLSDFAPMKVRAEDALKAMSLVEA